MNGQSWPCAVCVPLLVFVYCRYACVLFVTLLLLIEEPQCVLFVTPLLLLRSLIQTTPRSRGDGNGYEASGSMGSGCDANVKRLIAGNGHTLNRIDGHNQVPTSDDMEDVMPSTPSHSPSVLMGMPLMCLLFFTS